VVVEASEEAVGLALEPGGPVAVVIELGPVFGNTLRDGCGLLDVNEFPDSRDFNAISAALNRRVEERVLPGLRARAAPGTVVEFAGCVDITDPVRDTAPLRVVPFKVTFP
jgi:predicted lipoprotein